MADYPKSPLDLLFDDLRYDYVLPIQAGIEITQLLLPTGPFRCLDQYCSQQGFEALRMLPAEFLPTQNDPFCAEAGTCIDVLDDRLPRGYIVQRYAANAVAAKRILRAVIEGPLLSVWVIDWLLGHAPLLDYCGGFEITHLCPFVGDDERDTALAAASGLLDGDVPETYSPHLTRLTGITATTEESQQ